MLRENRLSNLFRLRLHVCKLVVVGFWTSHATLQLCPPKTPPPPQTSGCKIGGESRGYRVCVKSNLFARRSARDGLQSSFLCEWKGFLFIDPSWLCRLPRRRPSLALPSPSAAQALSCHTIAVAATIDCATCLCQRQRTSTQGKM